MDNNIIELVLGLVLIYAVLSLLVMKVQEQVFGQWFHYRAGVMHDLLLEACGQDETLKKSVLGNPLVFALYRDDKANKGLVGGKGPSSVPPEIFAKALLTELHAEKDKAHPAAKFSTPAGFLAAKSDAGQRIWQTLQILLPGHESDWSGFEGAIARWFKDIGDRSDGWFKRKASNYTLAVSAAVVFTLNVDSFHIANTLATDPPMRVGLADLAVKIDAARRQEAGSTESAARPDAAAVEPPSQAVSRALKQAMSKLTLAAKTDAAVAGFRSNQDPVKKYCPFVESTAMVSLGNAETWILRLPSIGTAISGFKNLGSEQARTKYEEAGDCIENMTYWVRGAEVATDNQVARGLLADAHAALDSAKIAVDRLAEQQPSTSLRRAFLANPEAFETCTGGQVRSRGEFEACLKRELLDGVRMPFLWTGPTLRAQLCKPVVVALKRPASQAAARPAAAASAAASTPAPAPAAAPVPTKEEFDIGGCDVHFPGHPQLGIPEMKLAPKGIGAVVLWLAGLVVTTIFVSFGAPFWFDLLSRVVKLRTAGAVREETDAQPKGPSSPPSPLPRPAGPSGGPAPAAGPAGASVNTRNAFESGLVPADVVRLQQALGVTASGVLDGPTRSAIRSWCSDQGFTPVTDELNAVLYQRIAGRPSANSARAGDPATARTGQKMDGATGLGAALVPVLGGFDNGASSGTKDVITPALRAQAVLFRYKRLRWGEAPGPQPLKGARTALAELKPATLDTLDEGLLHAIEIAAGKTVAYPREVPGWMDWAIGETGQVEIGARNRQGSNPRICEYLDTAAKGQGDSGDATPWCGAFVAWCLRRHAELQNDQALLADLAKFAGPLRAANWANWGTANTGAPQFGDIVLFDDKSGQSSGHVAFVVDTDGTSLWALGGNQKSGTQVCVSTFPASLVLAVRR